MKKSLTAFLLIVCAALPAWGAAATRDSEAVFERKVDPSKKKTVQGISAKSNYFKNLITVDLSSNEYVSARGKVFECDEGLGNYGDVADGIYIYYKEKNNDSIYQKRCHITTFDDYWESEKPEYCKTSSCAGASAPLTGNIRVCIDSKNQNNIVQYEDGIVFSAVKGCILRPGATGGGTNTSNNANNNKAAACKSPWGEIAVGKANSNKLTKKQCQDNKITLTSEYGTEYQAICRTGPTLVCKPTKCDDNHKYDASSATGCVEKPAAEKKQAERKNDNTKQDDDKDKKNNATGGAPVTAPGGDNKQSPNGGDATGGGNRPNDDDDTSDDTQSDDEGGELLEYKPITDAPPVKTPDGEFEPQTITTPDIDDTPVDIATPVDTNLSKEDAEKRRQELQENADKMKEKETNLVSRLTGAAAIGGAGIGGQQILSGLAEQSSDEAAERDMRAYLETFRCDFGQGKTIRGGETAIELPGGNELFDLYVEYGALAESLKTRKNALGLRAGIESEVVIDKAETGLYDNAATGISGGTYASVARAILDPEGEDAQRWAKQKSDASAKLKRGAVIAGVGLAAGIAGNIYNEAKYGANQSSKILNDYEAKKGAGTTGDDAATTDENNDKDDANKKKDDNKTPAEKKLNSVKDTLTGAVGGAMAQKQQAATDTAATETDGASVVAAAADTTDNTAVASVAATTTAAAGTTASATAISAPATTATVTRSDDGTVVTAQAIDPIVTDTPPVYANTTSSGGDTHKDWLAAQNLTEVFFDKFILKDSANKEYLVTDTPRAGDADDTIYPTEVCSRCIDDAPITDGGKAKLSSNANKMRELQNLCTKNNGKWYEYNIADIKSDDPRCCYTDKQYFCVITGSKTCDDIYPTSTFIRNGIIKGEAYMPASKRNGEEVCSFW